MFHLGMWRERLRTSMAELAEGRPAIPAPPREQQDEINDAELAGGIGIPLTDAAARCDHLLTELSAIYEKVGEKPFEWYGATTTTEAVLRSSLIHSSTHMAAYYRENEILDEAIAVMEKTANTLRVAQAPDFVMGMALYNLACVRVDQDRADEALELLREAFVMRPDAKKLAPEDADLGPLREDPRFKVIVSS